MIEKRRVSINKYRMLIYHIELQKRICISLSDKTIVEKKGVHTLNFFSIICWEVITSQPSRTNLIFKVFLNVLLSLSIIANFTTLK